jgi:hypothetical protein
VDWTDYAAGAGAIVFVIALCVAIRILIEREGPKN